MLNVSKVLPALFGLIIAIVCAPQVCAQGTSGKLPDPITHAELSVINKRLRLSDQQLLAVDRRYSDYRQQFQALRDGPIEQALQLARTEFAERLPRIMNQIADVDNAFFQQVQDILAADQQPMLERSRLMRERQRYVAVDFVQTYSTRAFADLVAIMLDEVSITPSEPVSAALDAYELQLTSGMRAYFRLAASVAGGDENAMPRMLDRGRQILALNLRTLTTLEHLLDDPTADELRLRFMRHAYAIVGSLSRLGVESEYAAALEMDLTEQQRQAIQSAWDQVRRQRRSLQQEAATLWDERGRIRRSSGEDMVDVAEVHEQVRELKRRGSEINANAQRQLHTMFDASTVDHLKEVASPTLADRETHSLTTSHGHVFTTITALPRSAAPRTLNPSDKPRHDHFLPGAMSRDDIDLYAKLFGLHDQLATDLHELHPAYVDWFESAIEEHRAIINEHWSSGRLGSGMGSDEALQAELQRIDKLDDERRTAQAAIRQVDDRLMQQLAARLAPDDQTRFLQHLQLARQRQFYERGVRRFSGHPNRAAGINLVALAAKHLQQSQLAERHDLLLEYERQFAAALERRFEALWQRQYAADRMFPLLGLEGGGDAQSRDEYIQLQHQVRQAHREVAEVNQRFVVELADDLPHQQQAELIEAFQRAAYPQVFDDPANACDAVTAAFALPDLTSEQRSVLSDIAAGFWPAYRQLTSDMIDHIAAHYGDVPANLNMGSADLTRQREAFANELEQLRFKRDEIHIRAIQGLRAVLSGDQIRRIGGLPDPGDERAEPISRGSQ